MRVFGRSLHDLIGYLRKERLSNIFLDLNSVFLGENPAQTAPIIKCMKERKNKEP
jgi:hypothetical protein